MHSIIYYSHSNVDYNTEELNKLAAISNEKNAMHNITGFLTYKDGYFVQYFEGEYENTQQLYKLIKNDERHTILFDFSKEINKRLLNDWDMRLITDENIKKFNMEYYFLAQFNIVKKNIITLDLAKDFIWQGILSMSRNQHSH